MVTERGVAVDHSTIDRWVQHFAPEMEKRLRWQWRRARSRSWRIDEADVKVRGKWTFLYRAPVAFRPSRSGIESEHDLGDGLEARLLRRCGRIRSVPDGGQHRCGARSCLVQGHGIGIAEVLPDALATMLDVDEEAFGARRQHTDAKVSELRIADIRRDPTEVPCVDSPAPW